MIAIRFKTTLLRTHFDCGPGRRGAVVKSVEHISTIVLVNICGGAGSSPAGSVGRDLNLQKLNYQYLTTSVAVVLVVR